MVAMQSASRRYLPHPGESVAVLAAWCCVVGLAWGHGIVPLGLFLLIGFVESPPAAFAAWGVVALLLIARVDGSRRLYGAALGLLLAACVVAIVLSPWKTFAVASAVPFLGLATVQIRRLVVGVEAEPRATGA